MSIAYLANQQQLATHTHTHAGTVFQTVPFTAGDYAQMTQTGSTYQMLVQQAYTQALGQQAFPWPLSHDLGRDAADYQRAKAEEAEYKRALEVTALKLKDAQAENEALKMKLEHLERKLALQANRKPAQVGGEGDVVTRITRAPSPMDWRF